jgi:HSP20 family protein
MRFDPALSATRQLTRTTNQFQKMLQDFDSLFGQGFEVGSYVPRVDISEDKDNLYLVAELPGMTENDVKVTVSEGILSIRGEKKRKEEHETRNYYRIERSHGEFVRQFTLPENLKEEEIEAEFTDGVLEVRIPKAEPTKPNEREIKISRVSEHSKSSGNVKLNQNIQQNQKSDSSIGEDGKMQSSNQKNQKQTEKVA